jgi:3-oxoacyl-[acyl-carrier-protein] synthase II
VSRVARIAAYDPDAEEVQIAAEVKDFDPITWIDFKQARRMSRFSQLAVAAAAQAIAEAGLQVTDANRDEIAVVINTGGGGIGDVATGERVFLEQGGKRVSPFIGADALPPPWRPARSASRTASIARNDPPPGGRSLRKPKPGC